jgi:hypothetical protein
MPGFHTPRPGLIRSAVRTSFELACLVTFVAGVMALALIADPTDPAPTHVARR